MNTPAIQNVIYEYRYSIANMRSEDVPHMSKLNLLRSKLPKSNDYKSCLTDDMLGRVGAIAAIAMLAYVLSLLF
mgnify:FL=1